ncbi:MAG TPA: hypothetical protein VK919_02525 [Solirubrobacterales bacterium]|nr:hypothetical protein [Solirubrobacterales bacterium]
MPPRNEGPCPLCGRPLYGWLTLPAAGEPASVGRRIRPEAGTRVLDRCEDCGVAVERGRPIDHAAELDAISERASDGSLLIDCPNRASLQAVLGGGAWAPLDGLPGRLALTPRSLALLAERTGHRLDGVSFPPLGPGQRWMWQTIVNAFTFHNNFAHHAWARRLRPAGARGRAAFAIDAVVTVLAAPLVAIVSFPLEAIASLANRGGRIVAAATRPPGTEPAEAAARELPTTSPGPRRS